MIAVDGGLIDWLINPASLLIDDWLVNGQIRVDSLVDGGHCL